MRNSCKLPYENKLFNRKVGRIQIGRERIFFLWADIVATVPPSGEADSKNDTALRI